MSTYRLALPFPPSVNTWLRYARGRAIKSKRGREWGEGAGMVISDTWQGTEPIAVPVSVTIELHAPTRRAYDIDNRAKAVLDALQAHEVIIDDSQVDALHVYRRERFPGGKAVVEVIW